MTQTSSNAHEWQSHEVFVFGANKQGIHGAGAAHFAYQKCGAKWGVGYGPSNVTSYPLDGSHPNGSFAIPTCETPGNPLPLEEIKNYVDQFLAYAENLPDVPFFLTRIGCGFAGYTDQDIAPMFLSASSNVRKPPEFLAVEGS